MSTTSIFNPRTLSYYNLPALTVLAAGACIGTACGTNDDDGLPNEAIVGTVQQIYTAVNSRNQADISALESILSPSLTDHTPREFFVSSGDDRADLMDRIVAFGAVSPDFRIENKRIFVAPEHVTVFSIASGSLAGEFLGFQGNHEPFRFGAIDVYQYRDGVISDIWHQEDFLAVSHQLQGNLPVEAIGDGGALEIDRAPVASPETVAFVRSFYTAIVEGDLAAIDEILSPSLIDHTPPPLFPSSGRHFQDTRARIEALGASAPDLEIEIVDIFATTEFATVVSIVSGTQNGEFLGLPASGSSFAFGAIDVHRIEDGKIVELWHHEDLLGLVNQLLPVEPGE